MCLVRAGPLPAPTLFATGTRVALCCSSPSPLPLQFLPFATVNGLTLGTVVCQAGGRTPLDGGDRGGTPPRPPTVGRFVLDEGARSLVTVTAAADGNGVTALGVDGGDGGGAAAAAAADGGAPSRHAVRLAGAGTRGVAGGALILRERVALVTPPGWGRGRPYGGAGTVPASLPLPLAAAAAAAAAAARPPTSPVDFTHFSAHLADLLVTRGGGRGGGGAAGGVDGGGAGVPPAAAAAATHRWAVYTPLPAAAGAALRAGLEGVGGGGDAGGVLVAVAAAIVAAEAGRWHA